ncbi:MAG: hypothetical protein BWX88_01579 [Planctomycetes bacterium ADurb.Bin126]|nr:MAG: hypothetical protein BWX88_01579 [Planctomycetes bacterium ADurb.Bin126]
MVWTQLRPIGVIHAFFTCASDAPIQAGLAHGRFERGAS